MFAPVPIGPLAPETRDPTAPRAESRAEDAAQRELTRPPCLYSPRRAAGRSAEEENQRRRATRYAEAEAARCQLEEQLAQERRASGELQKELRALHASLEQLSGDLRRTQAHTGALLEGR